MIDSSWYINTYMVYYFSLLTETPTQYQEPTTPNHSERLLPVSPSSNYLAEIEDIRLTLLHYKSDRQKLKTLQQHLLTLTECLYSLDKEQAEEVNAEIIQVRGQCFPSVGYLHCIRYSVQFLYNVSPSLN